MATISRNAHAPRFILTASFVGSLAVPSIQHHNMPILLPLTALLLRREDLAAQIEHRQRAWNLYSFAHFENCKVPACDV